MELSELVRRVSITKRPEPKQKPAESIDFSDAKDTVDTFRKCHSSMSNRYCKIEPIKKKLNLKKEKFSNVSIRNQSRFLKTEWTKLDEEEFQYKKREFVQTFKKGSNIPIIYQFVKKYTQTTKARDLLLQRWERKEDMTEEEIRYLYATSVFLNQSINHTHKQEIKEKIHCLNKDLLSRLEANIA